MMHRTLFVAILYSVVLRDGLGIFGGGVSLVGTELLPWLLETGSVHRAFMTADVLHLHCFSTERGRRVDVLCECQGDPFPSLRF